MDDQYVDSLRDQLVDAAHRRQRKTGRREQHLKQLGLAVLVLVAVIGAFTFVDRPKSDASVLQVQKRGALIDVSLTDLKASPKQVRDELRASGVSAAIRTVPVAKPMVGSFVALETGPALTPLQMNQDSFRRFTIDTSVSRKVGLSLGRAASPGEPYATVFDAYADGGPLHCTNVWGMRVADAASVIASHFDGRVNWKYAAPQSAAVDTIPEASQQKYVVDAELLSSNEMLVFVADSAKSPFVGSESTGAQQCTQ